MRYHAIISSFSLLLLLVGGLSGCGPKTVTKTMEVTAYCGCSSCCSWERGSWTYGKLDFWNRYVSGGPQKGRPYSGLTASSISPQEPQPGLFSTDSLAHPWLIPHRLIFFPWFFLPADGTIAADTNYYPFGTRIQVPGYGWGEVRDRGSAIRGPNRLDIYFDSHRQALQWGRQRVPVKIIYP